MGALALIIYRLLSYDSPPTSSRGAVLYSHSWLFLLFLQFVPAVVSVSFSISVFIFCLGGAAAAVARLRANETR